MCKRGKGNVRDGFRNLQQQEQTIENQDNMSLMGRETFAYTKADNDSDDDDDDGTDF